MLFHKVLAIETSCDDTSLAIVRDNGWVDAVVSANQDLQHRDFGGVVPEIASRNHTINLLPLLKVCLEKASVNWDDIDGIAVTSRPGLMGSLIVGLVTAKTLALSQEKPFLGVNHLEAHLLAPFLRDEKYQPPEQFEYPYIALAISGGHTHLYRVEGLGRYVVLGQTMDDAAGEAYDKFAKMMGLGFPGGIKVDHFAKQGDVTAHSFPRPLMNEDNFNFSFSGLKTAALRKLEKMSDEEKERERENLCASYQEAIVDVLLSRLDKAVDRFQLPRAVLTGGVSANSRLRARGMEWAQKKGVELVVPPIRYCTDNAAMVGYVGIQRLNRGEVSDHRLAPSPRVAPDDFIYEQL